MEVITANSLGDGRVVFRAAAGWTHDVDEAELLLTKEAVEAALAAASLDAAANRIVEPYAIPVIRDRGRIVPARLRERIRADGPTAGNSLHAPAKGKAA